MSKQLPKFEPPIQTVEGPAAPEGFKLQTMTEKDAEILALKVKAKEQLTDSDINMMADELAAYLITWSQKRSPRYRNALEKERELEGVIKNLEKQIEELKNPPKKWYQFWK